jgi:hypothetical protein
MAAFQLDLPAYLKRVGLDAAAVASPTAETLAALMLAQSRAHAGRCHAGWHCNPSPQQPASPAPARPGHPLLCPLML